MKCDWKKDLKRVRLYTPEQQRHIRNEALQWVKEDILPMITANVEAIILWQLHANHNKGKKWLLNFLEETTPMINGILDYYDYETDDDAIWICKHKLKTELGIDVDEAVTNFKATLQLKREVKRNENMDKDLDKYRMFIDGCICSFACIYLLQGCIDGFCNSRYRMDVMGNYIYV